MKKRIGLRAKMLAAILPFIILAMVIMTVMSGINSKNTIEAQISQTMDASLTSNINGINDTLDRVRQTAIVLSNTVAGTYKKATMTDYANIFSKTVLSYEVLNGCGIWFEPYVYDRKEKYQGPYWYNDGGTIVEDWEYSNEEYDYFSQEYYTLSKTLTEGTAAITDPYYDPSSGIVMASCVAPIFDNGTFIGCVTADIGLGTVTNMIGSIKVGEGGTAMLTTAGGMYIYTKDESKVQNAMLITSDPNASLASAAKDILAKEKGTSSYNGDGGVYNLYYEAVPGVNWKLIIQMPRAELLAPVNKLVLFMMIIAIIATVVCVIVVLLQVNSIAKSVSSVKEFAGNLASGDFTVEKVRSGRRDEIGQMSESLNEMYENNRDVISRISKGSTKVNDTSLKMSKVAKELSERFDSIQGNMALVNDAMTSTGAATEEVSASVAEVNESITHLANEVRQTAGQVVDIKKRALDIEKNSEIAHDNALSIVETRGDELAVARKKAEVVKEIGNLADSIADIADQINLLSLNASIEAARAGEQGKGFAVVASEINKLASETAESVVQIKTTIQGVQDAFTSLDGSASEMLAFLQNTVTPDYDNFVNIGRQYGSDAQVFGDLFDKIQEMVGDINRTMDEVNYAVQSIAESAQNTANSSSEVTVTVNDVSSTVNDVSVMASNQEEVATDLSNIVGRFKLEDTNT